MNAKSTDLGRAALAAVLLLSCQPAAQAMLTENRASSLHEHAAALHASRPRLADTAEAARWHEIQIARRPGRIAELCEAFLRDFPASPMREEVRKLAAGAARALSLQYEVGLSGDFFETTKGDPTFLANLMGAARGSPVAAFELARAFGKGSHGVFASLYRQEQWLRFAAELGHARASWELAELYNVYGRVGEAAHYEKRAQDLGYKPPPRLSNRDY